MFGNTYVWDGTGWYVGLIDPEIRITSAENDESMRSSLADDHRGRKTRDGSLRRLQVVCGPDPTRHPSAPAATTA